MTARFVPTVHQVAMTAAQLAYIPPRELLGPGRTDRLARVRFAVAWVARKHHGRSYPEIGRGLGNRDHTSMMNAVKRAEELIQTDPSFYALCETLAKRRRCLTVEHATPPIVATPDPTIGRPDIEDDGFLTVVGLA